MVDIQSLEYYGYKGTARFCDKRNVFVGMVEEVSHTVTFEAAEVISLQANFEAAVEEYTSLLQEMLIGSQDWTAHGSLISIHVSISEPESIQIAM